MSRARNFASDEQNRKGHHTRDALCAELSHELLSVRQFSACKCISTCLRDLFILRRALRTAHADGSNDVAFVHDGHATLKRVKSGKAVIVNRPLFTMSSNSFVGFLNVAEVRALPIETFAPATKLPSSRTK
jgi:hypothetical protein